MSVWSPGITAGQVAQIERVQKTACAVMLGASYLDYSHALSMLNLGLLSERRKDRLQTRSIKTDLIPVHTRTKRYERSPLPYLTSLLNVAGKTRKS